VIVENTDAMILDQPGRPVLITVADCVPVLLYDEVRHIGAVIHAGWRGTAQSIAFKTVCKVMKTYGCRPEHILAVIGPSVGPCCYEVSHEVIEALSKTVSESHQPSMPYVFFDETDRVRICLKTVNRLQLESAGLRGIETMDLCTRCY